MRHRVALSSLFGLSLFDEEPVSQPQCNAYPQSCCPKKVCYKLRLRSNSLERVQYRSSDTPCDDCNTDRYRANCKHCHPVFGPSAEQKFAERHPTFENEVAEDINKTGYSFQAVDTALQYPQASGKRNNSKQGPDNFEGDNICPLTAKYDEEGVCLT